MAQYVTIQELVNAEKWTGSNYATVFEFLGWDVWDRRDNSASGPNFSIDNSEGGDGVLYVIHPPVPVGDYIVKEADNSFTIIPEVEFEAKYQKA